MKVLKINQTETVVRRNDKKSQKGAASAQSVKPMIADEFLVLNNQNAERELPKEIAEAAQSVKIRIYTPQKDLPTLVKSRDNLDLFEFDLPPGSNIGLPGRELKRASFEQVRKGLDAKIDGNGHRPPWVNFNPHAKTTVFPTNYI